MLGSLKSVTACKHSRKGYGKLSQIYYRKFTSRMHIHDTYYYLVVSVCGSNSVAWSMHAHLVSGVWKETVCRQRWSDINNLIIGPVRNISAVRHHFSNWRSIIVVSAVVDLRMFSPILYSQSIQLYHAVLPLRDGVNEWKRVVKMNGRMWVCLYLVLHSTTFRYGKRDNYM